MTSENKIAIKISNLTKMYGNLVAVNNLSLDIYKGEIFGILGPNGAGKTTIINMISGMLSPTEGDISIFGKLSNKNILKTRIGLCPQENIFWPKLTCFEQLWFVGKMYDVPNSVLKKRIESLLNILGLEDKQNVLATKLSGGMKRRLNICLALINDPEIIILDEPEAGLDPQSRILVRNFIKSLTKDKTIILTTHNMDEADRLSHRVAIIDNGELLLLDTPQNLKETVGAGDILEIKLNTREKGKIDKIVSQLSKLSKKINVYESTLFIQSVNLVNLIPKITGEVNKLNTSISKFVIRKNTLEDVFISLTGRGLRQ
jgi:ABC-2 type transport system ATP-binding protein